MDRQHAAWSGLQAAQDPMGLYARTYRARVVAQSGDSDEVDVRPEDSRLPDMAKIPLRHGLPGLRVQVALGSHLLVGWDNGRPDKPFAALWNRDVHVLKLSLVADEISLTKRGATQAFVRGTDYRAAEDTLFTGLLQAFVSMAAACTTGPLGPLQPGIQQATIRLQQFLSDAVAARGYLSPQLRGE